MKLEYYSVDKLKQEVREIVQKYLDLKQYKVFFFGSRIKGDNFSRADIDIGIQGPKTITSSIKFKIEDDFEKLPTLYQFDLVDFQNVSDEFKKQALKHVEYL